MEEQSWGEKDIKKIINFLNQIKGESYKEIRRIINIIFIKNKILNIVDLKSDKDFLLIYRIA